MDVEQTHIPLSDLQKKAEEIIDGLKSVDNDIKRVTGRDFNDIRKGFNQRVARRRIIRSKNIENENITNPINVQAPLSSAHAVLPVSNNEEGEVPVLSSVVTSTILSLPAEEEKLEVKDEENSKRNKRMFGILLGTLKQFKQDNEGLKDQAIKRNEIEKKLEEKAVQEHEELKKQRRELFQLRREKQRDLRQLRRQIWMEELNEVATNHYENIKGNILVKFSPEIFYKPAKHSEVTKKWEEDTSKLLDQKKEQYLKSISQIESLSSEPLVAAVTEEIEEKQSSSHTSSNDEDEGDSQQLQSDIPSTNNDANN